MLVAENGYFGKVWQDRKWFALAWDHHSGAGQWPDKGPQRWGSWNVPLAPWRHRNGPPLVFQQRGIGEPGHGSPPRWAERTAERIGGRVRKHPGAHPPAVPLHTDLEHASCVATWHSSAALHALIAGVPVWYDYPHWIGAGAAKHMSKWGEAPATDDAARVKTLERMAWAMWDASEIESGKAFEELLCMY